MMSVNVQLQNHKFTNEICFGFNYYAAGTILQEQSGRPQRRLHSIPCRRDRFFRQRSSGSDRQLRLFQLPRGKRPRRCRYFERLRCKRMGEVHAASVRPNTQ